MKYKYETHRQDLFFTIFLFANLRLIAFDILIKYSNENLKYVPRHNENNSDILLAKKQRKMHREIVIIDSINCEARNLNQRPK